MLHWHATPNQPHEDAMSDKKAQRTHRTWEDWLGIALGIAVIFAPWIVNEISHSPALYNATIAGIAILLLAELDLVQFRRWPEAGLLLCGLWVAASPFLLGYGTTGALRHWHLAAGLGVAALGALGLREGQGGNR